MIFIYFSANNYFFFAVFFQGGGQKGAKIGRFWAGFALNFAEFVAPFLIFYKKKVFSK